jgi:hypothetical protein
MATKKRTKKSDVAPAPRDYLSTSEGRWRAISQGVPVCADTPDRDRAVTCARQFKLNIAHGLVWNGDKGSWEKQ